MIAKVKTVQEIYGQPATWKRCLNVLRNFDFDQLIGARSPNDFQWVFIGCGTSYYLAQAAAATFTRLTGSLARALPASEVLLEQELSIPSLETVFPVLISRSGSTSEVLSVANLLKAKGTEFLILTCDGNDLARTTHRVLQLPAKEESTVMTASFTSMLFSMQYLAATVSGNEQFIAALEEVPNLVESRLGKYDSPLREFAQRPFDDVAVLGQGALYPIAAEMALKVMESSSSYSQFFHTLEFRHGPKSIIDDRALVIGLLSEDGLEQEVKVLQEMKELGASTIAVVNHANSEVERAADLVIELSSSLPNLALLIAFVVWGQLFGSYVGLAKGLNPDEPVNLTRVVML